MSSSAPSLLQRDPATVTAEGWRQIPDWPYEASDLGRVRRIPWLDDDGCLHIGGEVALCPDKRKGKGYLYATLRDGERRRKAAVAVLVLEAWRGLRPGPGYEACHNNGVRTDNRLSELRWDTRDANVADMQRHRLERICNEEPGDVTNPRVSRGSASRASSRHGVTGDGPHGTGSFPFPSTFPSLFTSVQPAFRALRNRQAA